MMPRRNCHLIEMKLRHAEQRLNQIRTNITIHEQYRITHPDHKPTIDILKELRGMELQQESEVRDLTSELDACEAQNDMDRDKDHDKH